MGNIKIRRTLFGDKKCMIHAVDKKLRNKQNVETSA